MSSVLMLKLLRSDCVHLNSMQEFMYIVANRCCEIANDMVGYFVLKRCVNQAQGETRIRLINSIVQNSLQLAEHRYGLSVLEFLVSLKIPRATDGIIRKPQKNFVNLACNKYGRGVVATLLKDSGKLQSSCIILELLSDSRVQKLLVDPFASYVIGSALEVSKVSYPPPYI